MPMASNTRTRASDADRDRTAAALREHLAAGRLTIEEFDERLDKAYAAKALGELDQIMKDLPATNPDQVSDAPSTRSRVLPVPRWSEVGRTSASAADSPLMAALPP
jgi:signal recognition particle GTPase